MDKRETDENVTNEKKKKIREKLSKNLDRDTMTFRATSTLALCALSVIDREPSGGLQWFKPAYHRKS